MASDYRSGPIIDLCIKGETKTTDALYIMLLGSLEQVKLVAKKHYSCKPQIYKFQTIAI